MNFAEFGYPVLGPLVSSLPNQNILLSNLSNLSLPDDSYFRKSLCILKLITTFVYWQHFKLYVSIGSFFSRCMHKKKQHCNRLKKGKPTYYTRIPLIAIVQVDSNLARRWFFTYIHTSIKYYDKNIYIKYTTCYWRYWLFTLIPILLSQ